VCGQLKGKGAPLGFAVYCDEGVFGGAGEIGGAKKREDGIGGYGDAEICLGGGKDARDVAT